MRCVRITHSNKPPDHQLGISINRGPRPDITKAKHTALFLRYVFRLCMNETPNLIHLYAPRIERPNVLIVISRACSARICNEL